MTTEITLGGYTLESLKEMKAAIQQDANKFIADSLAKAIELTDFLIEAVEEENEEIDKDALAEEANALFESVDLVAGISGVTYYLDYATDYGYSDDRPISYKLDDLEYSSVALRDLYRTVESMEYDSRNWHQSVC